MTEKGLTWGFRSSGQLHFLSYAVFFLLSCSCSLRSQAAYTFNQYISKDISMWIFLPWGISPAPCSHPLALWWTGRTQAGGTELPACWQWEKNVRLEIWTLPLWRTERKEASPLASSSGGGRPLTRFRSSFKWSCFHNKQSPCYDHSCDDCLKLWQWWKKWLTTNPHRYDCCTVHMATWLKSGCLATSLYLWWLQCPLKPISHLRGENPDLLQPGVWEN